MAATDMDGIAGTLADPHVFDDYTCARCAHLSQRHAGYLGPCADCWAIMAVHICEDFIMREEDRAAVAALPVWRA